MRQVINLWLFGVILVCLILSLLAVVLRSIGRWKRRSFQLDDWMMLLAELLFIPCAVLALLSVSSGLGVRDKYLEPSQIITAAMYFSFFDLLYCITLAPLKCSLCATLLRFARGKTMRAVIYAMIVIQVIITAACFVALLVLCRPYNTNWRYYYDFPGYPKEGKCFSGTVILILAYVLTAVISISDLVCVVIPAIIFWNTQMDRYKKVMAWMLLSLGLLASVATLCRLPTVVYWIAEHDRNWGLGMATLCCCVETALGVLAGCAPAIRPLFAAVVSTIRSSLDTSKAASLPHARPTTVCDPPRLAGFSYNTADLKMIHSPRGDVVEITSFPDQWESDWTITSTIETKRQTV